VNRSKAKGSLFERQVVEYLQANGFPHAERRVTQGSQDRGDVAGVNHWVLEIKNHARMELADWVDQSIAEAINAGGQYSAVVHKRRGRPAGGAYVTMTLQQLCSLMMLEAIVHYPPTA